MDTATKENEFQIETGQACSVSREEKSTTLRQRWSDCNMKLYQYEDPEIVYETVIKDHLGKR